MRNLLTAALALAFADPTFAGSPVTGLRQATPCCWELLFREGTICHAPRGSTGGTVLYTDGKFPRVTARFQGAVWKGKTFHADGTFTNRWLGGVRAVSSHSRVEPSWLDGQPCLVMQYAPSAPVFGNVRDELRQIAPGAWLGRSYDASSGRGKNWFLLRER